MAPPKNQVASKKKSPASASAGQPVSYFWPFVAALLAAGLFALDDLHKHTKAASTKPYGTVEEFYPFYLKEHSDPTNKLLHFAGTTIILLITVCNPMSILALALGGMVGLAAFPHCRGYETGAVEAAAMFSIYIVTCIGLTRKTYLPFLVAGCGYAFAWVGHFNFELNKPATFVYPVFSLVSDFKMWYGMLTGEIPVLHQALGLLP